MAGSADALLAMTDAAARPTQGGTVSNTGRRIPKGELEMLYWAVVFFIVAIIAAVLGFGGVAGAAAGIAEILFFVFLVLLMISLIMHVVRGRAPRP